MEILRPLLAETGAEPIGKVVIGTVKGDIHDIGKNLVAMMLEGAGFEVIDLGINTDADKFLAALDEHKPDILGMSALLTTTMPYMKVVIDTLQERGLRDKFDRARRRRAAERGVRPGHRRRRLLPRRGRRRRDRQAPRQRSPRPCANPPVRPSERADRARPSAARARVRRAGRRAACRARCPSPHRSRRGALPARQPAQPTRADRARAARRWSPSATPTAIGTWPSPTPTAAPAASSTRCSPRCPASRGCPASHCYEFFAGRPLFAAAARRSSRHLLPDRLPGQALRRARLAGPRPRPPSGAARHVLRQLHAARAAVADRRAQRSSTRRVDGRRAAGPAVRAPPRRH